MSDLTIRLRNLAIQVRNGTYGNTSLDAINLEGKSIIDELYRIYETAEYNGIRLFNDFNYSSASYCYTTCDVTGVKNVGGIGGRAVYSMTYSYSTGNITGQTNVGGIVGELLSGSVHKSAVYGAVSGNSDTTGIIGGSMSGKVTDCMYNKNVNQDLGLVGENFTCTITNTTGIDFGAKVNLQVGINSDLNNQISFDAWFALDGLSRLKNLNLQDNSVLKIIDSILSQINKKQTEYGSVENRLESVLEEISIHYENLVSSRSTIRDADIAEESSEYIKMQILQQASATLLATANQTPAIALQLL